MTDIANLEVSSGENFTPSHTDSRKPGSVNIGFYLATALAEERREATVYGIAHISLTSEGRLYFPKHQKATFWINGHLRMIWE